MLRTPIHLLICFQAIDSPDPLASHQLLSYWVIFGGFFTLETSFG